MSLLWESLDKKLEQALFDNMEVLEDKLFIAALRAKISGVPPETLNSRLKAVCRILNLKRLDRDLFMTWKNVCTFEIEEVDYSIRKPKKYSGYVKSPSSVGSKRASQSKLLPEIFEWSAVNEIDLFHVLTVGEFTGETLVILLPEDWSKKSETVPKRKKRK